MPRGPSVSAQGTGGSRALVCGSILIAAALLAGCSLIGYSLGSKIDKSNRKLEAVDGWNLERVEVGTQVHALLRGGGEVSGVFEGVDYSAAEYAARYGRWRGEHADMGAPDIGGEVRIVDVGGKTLSGAFVAFDSTSLVLVRTDTRLVDGIPYRKIDRLQATGGGTWTGARVGELASQGRLPLRSCLVLENRPHVPLEQIDRVEMLHAGSTGRTVGVLVGAAVDAIVVASVIHSLNATPTPPPPTSSCPYVYSFDGQRYSREGDAFPGSMFAAAQLTDRLVLGHLDGSHGPANLRLVNELDEIEYVDALTLLAVDGPQHATVAPLSSGGLRVLSAPTAPTHAADLSGRAVLQDGAPWVSSPFADSAGGPPEAADGIVLEFPRPAAAGTVTLSIRAESLPWASHLLLRVLELHGTGYEGWYARTNADPAARAEFMTAFRREGNLRLQVWNGTSWRDEGFVPVHDAVERSLRDVPGDTLRIRLLAATPGLWKVDGVLADFGAATALDVIELPAVSARTASGEDVGDRLASADGRRLILNHGDSVDVAFAPPPPRPGRRRTFILKATGYYSVLVPAEGPPDAALFARLVREPGAMRQFSRDVLRGDIALSLARQTSAGE